EFGLVSLGEHRTGFTCHDRLQVPCQRFEFATQSNNGLVRYQHRLLPASVTSISARPVSFPIKRCCIAITSASASASLQAYWRQVMIAPHAGPVRRYCL